MPIGREREKEEVFRRLVLKSEYLIEILARKC